MRFANLFKMCTLYISWVFFNFNFFFFLLFRTQKGWKFIYLFQNNHGIIANDLNQIIHFQPLSAFIVMNVLRWIPFVDCLTIIYLEKVKIGNGDY